MIYNMLFVVVLINILTFVSCDSSSQKKAINSIEYEIGSFYSEYNNNTDTISMTSQSYMESDRLSEFISVDSLIYLDSEEPIGDISKIEVSNSQIFVLDSKNAGSVFSFDLSGRLLWSTDIIGEGPGERMKIVDFGLTDKHVFCLDNGNRKILKYDRNGGFQEEILLEIFVFEMFVIDDCNIMFNTNNTLFSDELDYKLLTLNHCTDSIIGRDLPFSIVESEFRKELLPCNLCSNFLMKSSTFIEPYSYDLYTLNDSVLNLKYHFDFGKRNLKTNRLELLSRGLKNTENMYKEIHNLTVFDDKVFFASTYNGLFHLFYYDPDYGVKVLRQFHDDITFGGTTLIPLFNYDSSRFITVVQPFHVHDRFDNLKRSSPSEKFDLFRRNMDINFPYAYDIMQKTNKSSNPVLLVGEILDWEDLN